MGYELTTGTKAPIIDQNGDPLADGTSDIAIEDGSIVGVEVDGTTVFIHAGGVGTTAVTVTPHGSTAVEHDVTVVAAPFDWQLGDPVPA